MRLQRVMPSALGALATGFAEQARIPVERRVQPILSLSSEQELVVYRVAQEALTNVARHAGATHVVLELACTDEHTVLRVHDDGRGMSGESWLSSNGIRGMRERALLIGATFSIDSAPGAGTEVRLTIPREAS